MVTTVRPDWSTGQDHVLKTNKTKQSKTNKQKATLFLAVFLFSPEVFCHVGMNPTLKTFLWHSVRYTVDM